MLTRTPFFGYECVATRSVEHHLRSASVATVVNGIAVPYVGRRHGEDSDTKPITGMNKASKVEKCTAAVDGATASGRCSRSCS